MIGDLPVSPLQYRYLFPDLASLPESEQAILRHYAATGREEIEQRKRVPKRDRLDAIRLQMLSPGPLRRAPPSPNWLLAAGSTGTLDVFFSHEAPEAGAFEPPVGATRSPHWRLHLKGPHHGFYQRGIPGLANSIDETATWIEKVVRAVKPTRLRFFGFGTAAYAAILFGHLLAADAIYAFAPEIVLGIPQYRSARRYKPGFHPIHRDLRPYLRGLADRLAIVYPAYEPMDFRMLQWVREAGVGNVALAADFHPAGLSARLDLMLSAEETPLPAERIVRFVHPEPYDAAATERVATAYESWADRDFARSERLLREAAADDPRNYGFMCHLAVHRALQGDAAGAEEQLRPAFRSLVADYEAYGARMTRRARVVLRSHYHPTPEQAAAIEKLFERVHQEVMREAGTA